MAAEPGMLKAVKRLMVTGSIKEKKIAIAAYTNLQAHAAKEKPAASEQGQEITYTEEQQQQQEQQQQPQPTTTKSVTAASSSTPASTGTGRTLQARAGLSMFGDSVRSKSAHTFTVYVSGLSTEETRDQVEKVLIKVKGVISFFFDLCEQKVVIRSMATVDDIITRITDNGFKASTSKKDIGATTPETNKENEPAYLDESKPEGANGSSWFGGFGTMTLFGESAEDRKAKQAQASGAGSGWFSKLKIW
jgi:copper chaperone CopZ